MSFQPPLSISPPVTFAFLNFEIFMISLPRSKPGKLLFPKLKMQLSGMALPNVFPQNIRRKNFGREFFPRGQKNLFLPALGWSLAALLLIYAVATTFVA